MNRSTAPALALALGLLTASCALFSGDEPGEDTSPKLWEGLGSHSHPITTSSPRAQEYFDQGLALSYGFNHDAAVLAFREAARIDPRCAMCAWGEGLALGPNINAPMGPEAARAAYAAVQRAVSMAGSVTEPERDYIQALATRYAPEPAEDRSSLDVAYAEAMRRVRTKYPQDQDAAVLAAEAWMDTMPWNYWTPEREPRENTAEVLQLLERVLATQPDHLGANHYLIHAVEEYFPERAEAAADRLATLAPDAGHLVHMPSHIYWRVGRYGDAIRVNQQASAADENFFANCRPGAFYRALYYPHNIHFLWAAASAQGSSQVALTAARKLQAKTTPFLEEFPFMSEFMVVPSLTLARFGRWDALLGQARPDPARPYLTGIWHYTRGVAHVRTGDFDAADEDLAGIEAEAARPESEALILAGGTSNAKALLRIGADHLRGELAAARGEVDAAVSALESAVAQQDALIYMEPPPWYFPTRQALGAVLLDAGRAAEAERVYRDDLEQHPQNGWSTFGLARSLEAQGKDAAGPAEAFAKAWTDADVTLTSSRF